MTSANKCQIGVKISKNKISDTQYAKIKAEYPVLDYLEEVRVDFSTIFSTKNPVRLDEFIKKYEQSDLKSIRTFARGLKKDYNAVALAVTSPLSNGPSEGINTKIKAFCRQAYGRCSDALLNAKMTLSHFFNKGSNADPSMEET